MGSYMAVAEITGTPGQDTAIGMGGREVVTIGADTELYQ